MRAIPKVRSPKLCGTVSVALGNTVACVVSPTPSKRVHREIRCLILAWQTFCNGTPAENYGKVCAVIRFLNTKGNTPIEIRHQLTKVYGESCMVRKVIQKWCREFALGHTEIHDKKPSGRPSICNETVAKFEETMRKDRRVSLDDLCVSILEVSRTTIYRILMDKLQYRKVCATWVPRMLAVDHKRQRVDSAQEFSAAMRMKRITFCIRLSWATKPGHTTSHLKRNNNHVSSCISLRLSRKN